MATNMKPSCDTVEYASTFLMSVCTIATVAAKNAVATPMTATTSEASGAIADFKVAWLDLSVRGGGGADDLRTLVMRSPLYAPQKANIDALAISGPAAVDLRLRLPLKKEFGEREVAGTLSLDNASVADSRYGVAFGGSLTHTTQ